MTPSASNRNVSVTYRRLTVIHRQNLVRAAMAVLAIGRACYASALRPGVVTVGVRLLSVGMALSAVDRRRCRFVRRLLHIRVAVHAGEHATVGGVLQLVGIDKQADLLAVNDFRQGCIGVAGQAVAIFGFVRGVSCAGTR